MRISALSSILVALAITTVAGSAHADPEYRYHARTHEVAAAEATHAYSATQTTAANAAPTPALGAMAITGRVHAARDNAELGIQAEAAISDPIARREPFLNTNDIVTSIAPYSQDLEHCYLDHGGHGGKLEVTVVIGRDGKLTSLKANAQGVSPKATHKIEACLKEIGETVEFPERRSETTAVLPWLFQKTSAPGAGPILSCWNAKGC